MASMMEGIAYQDTSNYHRDIKEVAAEYRAQQSNVISASGLADELVHMVLSDAQPGCGANTANHASGLAQRPVRVPTGPRRSRRDRRQAPRRDRYPHYPNTRGDYYRPRGPRFADGDVDMADADDRRPSGRFYNRNPKRKRGRYDGMLSQH